MDKEIRMKDNTDAGVGFTEEAKQRAVTLAAFELLKEAHDEGLITDEELKTAENRYIKGGA